MNVRVETSIYKKNNVIIQKTFLQDEMLSTTDRISEKIIGLQDQGIKEALIKLGWKPPANGIEVK